MFRDSLSHIGREVLSLGMLAKKKNRSFFFLLETGTGQIKIVLKNPKISVFFFILGKNQPKDR